MECLPRNLTTMSKRSNLYSLYTFVMMHPVPLVLHPGYGDTITLERFPRIGVIQ